MAEQSEGKKIKQRPSNLTIFPEPHAGFAGLSPSGDTVDELIANTEEMIELPRTRCPNTTVKGERFNSLDLVSPSPNETNARTPMTFEEMFALSMSLDVEQEHQTMYLEEFMGLKPSSIHKTNTDCKNVFITKSMREDDEAAWRELATWRFSQEVKVPCESDRLKDQQDPFFLQSKSEDDKPRKKVWFTEDTRKTGKGEHNPKKRGKRHFAPVGDHPLYSHNSRTLQVLKGNGESHGQCETGAWGEESLNSFKSEFSPSKNTQDDKEPVD